ncbi:hypothetical protein [Siphonobacter sp.]|uniref:hypothetical protein n=1 Tax=Siphonobacter sp. TaxID=1869184 RepID=UPI003B3B3E7D
MADTNFFTSGNFGTALTTAGGIATGFLQNANAEIQGKYAKSLAEINAQSALTESERQQKIAALNAQYQVIVQEGKDEARADYLKWGLLMGGVFLGALALWLGFGKKRK